MSEQEDARSSATGEGASGTRRTRRSGLVGLSIAHPAVPASERVPFTPTARHLAEAYETLAARGTGTLVLTTCLRTEVLVAGGDAELAAAIGILFGDRPLPEGAQVLHGDAAVRHLFRVAAGIDSPVVGEPEVLTQLRQAFVVARRHRATGALTEVVEAAIATGRAARRIVGVDARGSLAGVAVALVPDTVTHVALVGAGAMAAAVVDAFRRRDEEAKIVCYARRPEAVLLDVDDVVDLGDLAPALERADVVISATGAKRTILDPEVVRTRLARRTEPLLLIDLAMPPDFDPVPDRRLRYVGVDELAAHARRTPLAEALERHVRDAAEAYIEEAHRRTSVGPMVRELYGEADRLADEAVARFAGKVRTADDPEPILRQLARTVARSVLHRPVDRIARGDADAAAALAEAFGIDDAAYGDDG